MIDVGGVVLDGGALTVGAGITPPDGGIGVGVAVAGAEGGPGAPMSAAAYAAAAVCLFFIGFFGFFTNLVVIVLMCREKQLWTPLNVILFNLVVSDFSVSILGNPFTLASALAHRWLFGRLMCIVYGFFMSLLGISSITTLTVLSFERYLMISKPFRGKHLNHKGSAFLVISIWIYSLALTTPPLFGWGEYINESANISCSVNWETSNYNHTTYIVYLFAMGLFVPASVICYSYLNIIRSMKKNVRVGGHVTKAEKKVAMMVAIMIVAFFFAWTPYAILALLIAFADAQVAPWLSVVPALMAKSSICYNPIIYVVLNTQVASWLSLVPALIAKSSICYNPIIYVVLNTQFRSAWRRLLGVTVSLETSGEVVGTLASPAHNVSYSVNHQLPPTRTARTTTTDHHLPPSTLVVHLDTTTDPTKMASVLCKPPNNNTRSFYFFHQQQQKTPKKKKRRAKFVASASTCCRDRDTCVNDRDVATCCNVRETCGNEMGLELKDMSARTAKVMTLQLKKASSENSVVSK